jgi:haloalkane dehalogenase
MSSDGNLERRVFLSALGVETRVLTCGIGMPIVLLHGNPDNADEWQPLIDLLDKDFRCIAADFPGYGKSPEPPSSFTYSIEDQISFLNELLRTLEVDEKVLLVVHDIGGMLGIPWAARNSGRVHALMVTNTVAFEGFRWFSIARRWGEDSWTGRLRARAMMLALGFRKGALFKKLFWQQSP